MENHRGRSWKVMEGHGGRSWKVTEEGPVGDAHLQELEGAQPEDGEVGEGEQSGQVVEEGLGEESHGTEHQALVVESACIGGG